MVSAAFQTEMDRKRGSIPVTKVEFITKADVTTDISSFYLEGANFEQIKERAPDEIQAGQFDIILSNHTGNFSEFKSGSLLFGTNYHGDRIKISQGFRLPDGTTEFETQGVGYIDQLTTDPTESRVTFRCRDLLWRVMDQKLHVRPSVESPVKASANIGNGLVTQISTKPFATINDSFTLTCTLGGGDGVATFSVVGVSAGSLGTATSGTEFTSSSAGIKFTINVGSGIWVVGDIFTFSTKQYPQWDKINAGKIIWSILTGFNFDSDTVEPFSDLVFDFDRTQSSANTELDYDSFVTAISNITDVGVFDLKGFAGYDEDAVSFLQNITLQFLGSLFTGNDGRIKLKTFIPTFETTSTEFTDSKKITALNYTRTIDEVINSVSVAFKATDTFVFSDESNPIDGFFGDRDAASIAIFKELGLQFTLPWFTDSGLHAQDFAEKLIAKFSEPPLSIQFTTGLDALTTEIGDRLTLTDTKLALSEVIAEVSLISKNFDQRPHTIVLRGRRDAEIDQEFGFIGSEVDEGDGLSPQSDDFSTASTSDKGFAYFSKIGETDPDYRMF